MHPGRYDDRSHARPAADCRARAARCLPLLPAAVSSIPTLFEHEKAAPHGLSAWDRALLYALYHTSQDIGPGELLQVSRIRESMVSQILSSGRRR